MTTCTFMQGNMESNVEVCYASLTPRHPNPGQPDWSFQEVLRKSQVGWRRPSIYQDRVALLVRCARCRGVAQRQPPVQYQRHRRGCVGADVNNDLRAARATSAPQ